MHTLHDSMARKVLAVAAVLVLTTGFAFAAGQAEAEAPEGERPSRLSFMSGPIGGSWYPLGGAAAEIIQNELPGTTVEVAPGAGLVNIEGIMTDKADIALGNSPSSSDGVQGNPPFEQPATKVRNLMNLYRLALHVVSPLDSDIDSIDDLEGRVVSTQKAGNTGEQMFRRVLEVYGLDYEDLQKVHHLSHADSANLVRDRHADVMAHSMNVPGPAIMELMVARDMKLVPLTQGDIEDLQQINGGYTAYTIPAGSYPNQDQDILAVGMISHFMVSEELPDDMVYEMVKALHENIDKLVAVVPNINTDPEFLAADIGVPFHPGAIRYFEELGVR